MLILPKIIDQLKSFLRKEKDDYFIKRRDFGAFIHDIETKYHSFDFGDIDIHKIGECTSDAKECFEHGLLKMPFTQCAFQTKVAGKNGGPSITSMIFVSEIGDGIFKAFHIFEHVAEMPNFFFEMNNGRNMNVTTFPHLGDGGAIRARDFILDKNHAQEYFDYVGLLIIGFSMLLNTRGISSVHKEPNKDQNRLRKLMGKTPIPAYNLVIINPIRGHGVSSENSPGIPKRTHYRRGHRRTYQNGRQIWIRPMLIKANPDDPIPDGHYEVKF